MKCLTPEECEQEARRLGLDLEEKYLRLMDLVAPVSASFRLPLESRRQAVLTNVIFSQIEDPTRWFLWISEWGVFPTEEYPVIWTEIREKHGEVRELIEAPGHRFEKDERELVQAMTRLAMLFGWDAFLWTDPVRFVVFISHDEVVDLYARDGRELSLMTSVLGEYGFEDRGA